jgi:hypothetical protein
VLGELSVAFALELPDLASGSPGAVYWTLSGSVAEFSGALDSTPGFSLDWTTALGAFAGGVPLDAAIAAPPSPIAARSAAPVAASVLRGWMFMVVLLLGRRHPVLG